MPETKPLEEHQPGPLESVTFYIDLAPGTKADLEVVARASLAFAEAVRELSFVLDPSLNIRVELVSGTEGSLSLNSLLRFFGRKDATAKENAKIIAWTMVAFFTMGSAEHLLGRAWDWFLAPEERQSLSPEQIERMMEKVAETAARKVAETQVQRVYGELQTDPAISGVAVARGQDVPRSTIVPRSEFGARSGLIRQEVESGSKRTQDEIVNLRLISPVLLTDTGRKWRFKGAKGNVSVAVKDARFLDDVINGRTAISLVGGIEMEVELRTVEEKKGGVWNTKDQTILAVRRVRIPSQASLDLARPPR